MCIGQWRSTWDDSRYWICFLCIFWVILTLKDYSACYLYLGSGPRFLHIIYGNKSLARKFFAASRTLWYDRYRLPKAEWPLIFYHSLRLLSLYLSSILYLYLYFKLMSRHCWWTAWISTIEGVLQYHKPHTMPFLKLLSALCGYSELPVPPQVAVVPS